MLGRFTPFAASKARMINEREMEMMLRRLVLVLAFLTVLGAIPGTARADEPIHLRLATIGAPNNDWYRNVVNWAATVEKESDGLLQIQVYPGGSIADIGSIYDRLRDGVADIAFGNFSPVADQFRKTYVFSLPFMTEHSATSSVAIWRLYQRGAFTDEFKDVRPIALFGFGQSTLHFVKPIKSVDDLKGMKILVSSRTAGRLVELLGAAPISMLSDQSYAALQHGLGQGIASTLTGMQVFKFDEITKYHVEMPLGESFGYVFFNKASYARLPDKAKQVVDKETGEAFSKRMGKLSDDQMERVHAQFRAGNTQVIEELPAADIDRARTMVEPYVQDWVKQIPDGSDILAAYRGEIQKLEIPK